MTGDGINDVQALKATDVVCEMGNAGTDVAIAASDMIITDDNLASIIEAVEVGRMVYENIRRTIQFYSHIIFLEWLLFYLQWRYINILDRI